MTSVPSGGAHTVNYEQIAAALASPLTADVRISVTLPGDVVLWERQASDSADTLLITMAERFINVMRRAQGRPLVALTAQETI